MANGTELEKPAGGSGLVWKSLIVIALAAVVVLVVAFKGQKPGADVEPGMEAGVPGQGALSRKEAENEQLPRLVDLGAGKCIPCKMMAPILEELKTEYEGQLEVVFIDVWENKDAGKPYGIKVIPTQIFFDASGREFFRHEGFFSKEDILNKFKERGISLDS